MGVTRKYDDQEVAAALASAVQELPDNWLMCRDVRHAWDVEEDFHVTESKGSTIQEVRRILKCLRCQVVRRHERYHPTKWGLEKVGQHYEYLDTEEGISYQIHGVPRGVKPSFIIQGEQYRRVTEKLALAAKKKKPLKVV